MDENSNKKINDDQAEQTVGGAERPPVERPPVDRPPVDRPPVDRPPVDRPPISV